MTEDKNMAEVKSQTLQNLLVTLAANGVAVVGVAASIAIAIMLGMNILVLVFHRPGSLEAGYILAVFMALSIVVAVMLLRQVGADHE